MTNETDRYSCQIVLPGFGDRGQKRLKQARVLIVGMGGLGCPTAQYLVSAGVGSLTLQDHDKISLTNLHRQILYRVKDVGLYKSRVATKILRLQNPQINIKAVTRKITAKNAQEIIRGYDIVVDCTDNFTARYAINDACVIADVPLVYGGAYQQEGQIAVWNIRNSDGTHSPNYRDVFPSLDLTNSVDCTTGGVMPTLTGIVGCIQANEVIKYLIGGGRLLSSRLMIVNSHSLEITTIDLPSATNYEKNIIKKCVDVDNFSITIAKLRKMLVANKCELVDVRTKDEHSEYNIGGKLVPLDEIKNGYLQVSSNLPVVFYCQSGARSLTAVMYARRQFPENQFYSLDGGVLAWLRSNKLAQKV